MDDTRKYEIKSKFKLAQLWQVVRRAFGKKITSHNAIINNIFKDDFDVNQKVTIRDSDHLSKEHLKDCTALHFVYYDAFDLDTFSTLLERGADYTVKNGKGNSVLHSAINMRIVKHQESEKTVPFIESVLSAHVKHQNVSNPQNENGLSHLHGACIVNHIESLKLFIDADPASISQVTHSDWDYFPTFTPLHFAMQFNCIEATQLLLSLGADISAKNDFGMTPLDECFNSRMDLLLRLSEETSEGRLREEMKQSYQEKLRQNEKLIKLFLASECVSAFGLSKLHIASTLEDLSIAENLLSQDDVDVDYAVPMESSSSWAGYTAAHFAALNSIDAVKMLLRRGAKIEAQNAQGTSALAICLLYCKIQGVHNMLASFEDWKNLRLSDGQTAFLDSLQATASVDRFKLFIQDVEKDAIVPGDCLLLKGCTMLHLAVIFTKKIKEIDAEMRVLYDKSMVEECLKLGYNVNVQNLRGESAIHLAYKSHKMNILQLLFEQLDSQEEVENLVNQDNLSYLHIACAEKNVSLVEKLLRRSNPNVFYKGKNSFGNYCVTGSTPLHVAAISGVSEVAELLLRHGADLHAKDSNDMTPIHCTMMPYSPRQNDRQVANVLLRSLLDTPRKCISNTIQLSYLHVACFYGNLQAVQKLLELGSDINAVISSLDKKCMSQSKKTKKECATLLRSYGTLTPLHMAQASPTDELIDLLIVSGSDVFAKLPNKYMKLVNDAFPIKHKSILRRFMLLLWDREDMQKSWEEKLGLTRLHIACYLKNEESVRSVLNSGVVNVNAQMHKDSKIFAGCTPLHLLVTISRRRTFLINNFEQNEPDFQQFTISPMLDLLLDRNADVTIMNAKKNTPIHLFCKYRHYFTDLNRCENLLFNGQRDFGVNPENADGMSHFHLACYWRKAEIVEKFLKHGSVDVNRPVDFFDNMDPGATPLHLALTMAARDDQWPGVLRTVDLLLEYGADVKAIDSFGDTPLHKAVPLRSPELSIFNKLVSHGADIYAENVKGQTTFDNFSFRGDNNANDFVSLFKKYNYRINSWNRMTGEGNIGKMLSWPDPNIVESPEFKELFQSQDVTKEDGMGRTAIHNTVSIVRSIYVMEQNLITAIEKFAAVGIDVNYQDKSGQTALHYAVRLENKFGVSALLKCGADVNFVDNNGKSAFSLAIESSELKKGRIPLMPGGGVAMILHLHVKKLLHLGIEVSELNQKFSNSTQRIVDETNSVTLRFFEGKFEVKKSFFNQVEKSKNVSIGVASLALFDFLNETNGVTLYPYLTASEKTVVDEFFKNFDGKEFDELTGIMKLQYHKMKARLELIDPALTALRTMLGFSFAGLCEQITRFLLNSDLKNLIASTKFRVD